jgi:ribose transport system substrate-binding protein
LTPPEAAAVRAGGFSVAVVLHTLASDWSRQELAGIVDALRVHETDVVEVVDCGFDKAKQNCELRRLAASRASAVISIPIGVSGVAEAHRAISKSGKALMLLDNAPTGLLPGADYTSVVSTDNFSLGGIAADLLSPHVPHEGVAGILTYGPDFFAANEREIAFRKWMGAHRPDVTLVRGRFASIEQAGAAFDRLMGENEDLDSLFVTWDEPALRVLAAMRVETRKLSMTTVDLGNAIAAELAKGDLVKGVAAQCPYDQGRAAAVATLQSLIGRAPPPWIAMPGLAVKRGDVIDAYQTVWHTPAPPSLLAACERGPGCRGDVPRGGKEP